MEQLSPIPPPPKSNDKGAKELKRIILASLKWGERRSRCSIYFVQDCRIQGWKLMWITSTKRDSEKVCLVLSMSRNFDKQPIQTLRWVFRRWCAWCLEREPWVWGTRNWLCDSWRSGKSKQEKRGWSLGLRMHVINSRSCPRTFLQRTCCFCTSPKKLFTERF